ncbi:unnamed protein product [Arabidopsis halleri]
MLCLLFSGFSLLVGENLMCQCSCNGMGLALAKAKGPNSWFLQERTHGRHPEAISARLGSKVKVSWKLSSITKLKSGGYNFTYETPEGICTEQSVVMTVPFHLLVVSCTHSM